jgi:sporulation protein YlmC with PRC-barrel domain
MTVLSTRMLKVAAFAMVPIASAMAQTQPPIPSQQAPPEVIKPQTTLPKEHPGMPAGKGGGMTGAYSSLVGLRVMSSDGQRLGSVQNVRTTSDGKALIFVKTGGFLGFGARTVAIPEDKFARSGEFIQVALTVQEVSKLPEVED